MSVPGSYGTSGQHLIISNSSGDKLWFQCDKTYGYVEIRQILLLDLDRQDREIMKRAFRQTCVINGGKYHYVISLFQ